MAEMLTTGGGRMEEAMPGVTMRMTMFGGEQWKPRMRMRMRMRMRTTMSGSGSGSGSVERWEERVI